jgi:hypothetical protein
MVASSELVAGVDVDDRQREEGEADREHDGVHHGNAPSKLFPGAGIRSVVGLCNLDSNQDRANKSLPFGGRLGVTNGIGIREGRGENVIGIP